MLAVTRRDGRSWISILAMVILFFSALTPLTWAVPEVYAVGASPTRSQEGTTITILLHVQSAAPSTTYGFVFTVVDPASTNWVSVEKQFTTVALQTEFYIVLYFPSSDFGGNGVNSLVGLYRVSATQTRPVNKANVASTFFVIGLTDQSSYQRTQTVSIQATNYQSNEPATVSIRTSPSAITVYNHPLNASNTGTILDNWYIPKNADISQTYVVTVAGTLTNKNPADVDSFTITTAPMMIPSIATNSTSYSRTQTVRVSFEPVYPSLENATIGSANVTLIRSSSATFNIRASYDPVSKTFVATYKTVATDPAGTWTARLAVNSFDDSYGNKGPLSQVSTTFTVQSATLSVLTTLSKASFAINEEIPFNATIRYPDGSSLPSSGTSMARLSLNGGAYTATMSLIYDTSTNQWKGLYTPSGNEPAGLWSLTVNGTDHSTPADAGTTSNVITLNKRATSLSISCTPNQVSVGEQVTCNATVTDIDVGTPLTPTGTVTISPAFANPQTCALPSGAGAAISCSVIFITGPNSEGTNSVTLSYSGDNHEALSSATSSVVVQPPSSNNPGSSSNPYTLPLFYFAIIALIVAAIVSFFLAFRHKTTHTKLKIDLEAVKSEAGKIENQAFFQSVKDQLAKDKNEQDGSVTTGGSSEQ